MNKREDEGSRLRLKSFEQMRGKLKKGAKAHQFITIEETRSLVACAYAKGVADGCKHMLETYRRKYEPKERD